MIMNAKKRHGDGNCSEDGNVWTRYQRAYSHELRYYDSSRKITNCQVKNDFGVCFNVTRWSKKIHALWFLAVTLYSWKESIKMICVVHRIDNNALYHGEHQRFECAEIPRIRRDDSDTRKRTLNLVIPAPEKYGGRRQYSSSATRWTVSPDVENPGRRIMEKSKTEVRRRFLGRDDKDHFSYFRSREESDSRNQWRYVKILHWWILNWKS